MFDKEDWRLTNQEDYLQGVTLYWKKYKPYRDTWDHDHCSFCWVAFGLEGGGDALAEGYATEDDYHWICEKCFEDFKDMFHWRIGKISTP